MLSFLFTELTIVSGVLGALAFLLPLIVFVGCYLYQRSRRGTPDKEGSLQFDCLLLTYGFLPKWRHMCFWQRASHLPVGRRSYDLLMET